MHLRILRDVVFLVKYRQKLFRDNSSILVIERVVFRRTIGRAITPFLSSRLGLFGGPSRVDKHSDHYRDLAAINKVVHDILRANVTFLILERVSILEHHQSRWNSRIVLGRNVYPIRVLRPRIGIAWNG